MLFILLSWIYIISISSVFGISLNRLFNIQKQHPATTILIGFFGMALLTGFYAIWFPIDVYFQIFLVLLCVILVFINKSFIVSYIKLFKQEVCLLNAFNKWLLGIVFVLILAQCASPPFVLDNESYYIQTINWLNEYGFVKGLVNLHLFLGQTSGWHILQSAFNFSFIYDSFNDLSGLALLLGNFYAISQLNKYANKTDKSRICLAIGLFPVFNVFFFQFISAPSPDIAIYVLSLIVFHQFILCYKTYSKSAFLTITILVLFMVFIKPTALPFLLLPLILFKRFYVFTRSIRTSVLCLAFATVFLIVIKNWIITGNLVFPLKFIDSLQASWSLPNSIQTYFSVYGKAIAYHMSPENYEVASPIIRFKHWLLATGLHGLFNKTIIALLIIMPFLLKSFFNKKPYWMFYGLALVSFMALLFIAPQYRFYFPFIMIFGLLTLALIVLHKKSIQIVLITCTLLAAIPLAFEINNQNLTTNTNHIVTSTFKLEYFLHPHSDSKYPSSYNTRQVGNLKINTPTDIDFFWATGSAPIPALNQKQLDYFKTHFNIIPQKRLDNIKDGFYSKKIN